MGASHWFSSTTFGDLYLLLHLLQSSRVNNNFLAIILLVCKFPFGHFFSISQLYLILRTVQLDTTIPTHSHVQLTSKLPPARRLFWITPPITI